MTTFAYQRHYDLSHWPTLPKVSCQCITYGRPPLLNEAVESFLRQDYPGDKELVILNDHPEILIDNPGIPEVHVINVPLRFRSIGEKRNACCALCSGDLIAPWDDDDISLPWRLSFSVAQMTNHEYFRPDRLWYLNDVLQVRRTVLAHAMSMWGRQLFDEVRGYPHIESGQDQAIESLFVAKGQFRPQSIKPVDTYYIYRTAGTDSYHLSARGWGKGMQYAKDHVKARVPAGTYELEPKWKTDYVALFETARVVSDNMCSWESRS
jgi:glycosyltransferase involved in cell wall biosynthesis